MAEPKASREAKRARRQTPSKPRGLCALPSPAAPADTDHEARLVAKARKLLCGKGTMPMPPTQWLDTAEGQEAKRLYYASPIGRNDQAEADRRHPEFAELRAYAVTEQGREAIDVAGKTFDRLHQMLSDVEVSDRADEQAFATAIGEMDLHLAAKLEPGLRELANKVRARPHRKPPSRTISMRMASILLEWERAKDSPGRGGHARTFAEHAHRYASPDEREPGLGVQLPLGRGYVLNGSGSKGIDPPSKSAIKKALKLYFAMTEIPTPEETSAEKMHARLTAGVRAKLEGIIQSGLDNLDRDRK